MEIKSAVDALSALANESRLEVFRLLVPEGPNGLPAGEIGNRLGIPANALSFHLTRLRHAGLVTVRRNGQQKIYAAAYEGMQGLMDYLAENCCRNEATGCSTDCPQPSSTEAEEKHGRRKVRIA
ncbi:MAG: helix-turn-helix transcriptional regulator [Proteobacteria bacterium]|nr:helix-turn-helix transcriptional regulator [Pseudomonadota bacterium]